jgi:carbon storage regulator
MLVLSRKEQEKIYIGKDICITVIDIQGNYRVRLGIEAPIDIAITRDDPPEDKPTEDSKQP